MAEAQALTVTQEILKMQSQFAAALPAHVTPEKFVRVVLTAVNGNPDLQAADRRSLYEAAMRASQDGLLPDGREAAFVVFNTKSGKKAQYLPMIAGILKKVRNSGELESLTANVVYEKDEFRYELGDDEKIIHKPMITGLHGKPIAAYAIVKTKDGGVYREVMTEEEINKVRDISKAKDSGPWSGPFFTEMWRKTVLRRLCKRVPMSTDLETLVNRDDELYDLATDVTPKQPDIKIPQPLPTEKTDAGKTEEQTTKTEGGSQDSQAPAPMDNGGGAGVGKDPEKRETSQAESSEAGKPAGSESVAGNAGQSVEEQALAAIASWGKEDFPKPDALNPFFKGQSITVMTKLTSAYNARKKELGLMK